MKSIKCLFFSFIALCTPILTCACWDPWYAPSGYYMYRVYEKQHQPNEGNASQSLNTKNCIEWQKLKSHDITLDDIYQVVYKMPLE
ncbi:MAG: hypothetical protein J6U43_06345 [Bacteroidales bacterium]|nr:hypothetical protein [Bacteroidales bacterium]